MTGLLDGHLAVVTGSGSGIGRAIALGYATQGAQVVALDIDGDSAAETVKAISRSGGKAHSFALDVRERDRCRDIAAQIELKIGQISILVNNAGINRRNAFTAEPQAVITDWQDILAINLNGVFNVTHAFLAQLRATKGRIINIASIQSFMHVRTPNSPAYTTSKHGVLGFTRALAALPPIAILHSRLCTCSLRPSIQRTRFVARAGRPAAKASATAMPKFSWWDGSTNTSEE